MVNVKEAVKAAKEWILDVMKEEQPTNLGLEEVKYDDMQGIWENTVGFSRPWNTVRNALTNVTGEPIPRRTYRIITVLNDGTVMGMRRRNPVED